MENNTTNEGMVNNSNQPSQTEKLNGMINKKITDLTEQLGEIGNEINELKKIEVTDEITKIVVGSTEFNIENFMSEPDIKKYRKWLELKEKWEKKTEDEIQDFIVDEKDDRWKEEWRDIVTDNFYDLDIDVWDYMSERDFVYEYMDSDSQEVERVRDDFFENISDNEVLKSQVELELKYV